MLYIFGQSVSQPEPACGPVPAGQDRDKLVCCPNLKKWMPTTTGCVEEQITRPKPVNAPKAPEKTVETKVAPTTNTSLPAAGVSRIPPKSALNKTIDFAAKNYLWIALGGTLLVTTIFVLRR